MNDMTNESSDSESEELSDYMGDEENTSESGSDEENVEDRMWKIQKSVIW